MPKIKKDKILILTGQYGEGHRQAANAITETIWERNMPIDTIVMDPSAFSHPILDSLNRYFVVKGVQKFPAVYHSIYQKTRYDNYASTMLKRINRIGAGKIWGIINEIDPSMIISTCPITAGIVSNLKKTDWLNVPASTVITDYSVHSYWVNEHTDAYFVGSEKVRNGLLRAGVDNKKIFVTGIPTDPKYSKGYNRVHLKEKHGLNGNMPTVLIGGGGCGIIGDPERLMEQLNAVPYELQLIIVCGHNERLYRQLERRRTDSKHQIILTGYVDHLEEYMAVADFMLTKPGGLTVSEAIAMNLPLLLFQSLGGQEYDNAQYLAETKAALVASDFNDLYQKINRMITDRTLLAEMKIHQKKLRQNDAAMKIVENAVGILDRPDSLRFAF
ncbi:MAG TPA: glycosyltransferase [Bacillales bacterium]|nr:glycosyltransferase [Bacillales bacterium]